MQVTAQKDFMRGLHNYIAELHDCQTKEKEKARVDKELGKIRKTFKEAKGDSYSRRKYVSKLVYTYMFGYEVDFGYTECLTLLSSPKYHEKSTGYLAMQTFLNEKHEMIPLIVNSLQDDLRSRNDPAQGVALNTIGSIGGMEMAEVLAPTVCTLITKSQNPFIRKKAVMCFLRLLRKSPSILQLDPSISQKLISLLDDFNLSLVNCVLTVLIEIAPLDLSSVELAIPQVLKVMSKILSKSYQREFSYHNIVHPWTQVKCLQFLRMCMPTEKKDIASMVEILKRIIRNTEFAKGASENQKNAQLSVIFEAITLIVTLDFDEDLVTSATKLLCKFISARESNVRYLALEAMEMVTKTDAASLLQAHLPTIYASLRDPDISIRRRALDLVYAMADKDNAKSILEELLDYLESADLLIREELVLKISIIAEKYSVSYRQYIDIIVRLVSLAGDYVSGDIWYRLLKIVLNNESVQEYASSVLFENLQKEHWHEVMVSLAAYALGEWGHLIAEKHNSPPEKQFQVLHKRFPMVSAPTKALLLTTYCKFVNVWPELRKSVRKVLQDHSSFIDAEIQQRALEYLQLTLPNAEELLGAIMDSMPPWEGKDGSLPSASGVVEDFTTTEDHSAKQQSSGSKKDSIMDDLLGLGLGSTAPATTSVSSSNTNALDLLGLGNLTATAPVSSLSSSNNNNLNDLLGLGISVPSASASVSTSLSATAPVGKSDDLLGLGLTTSAPQTSLSSTIPVTSTFSSSSSSDSTYSDADYQKHKGLWRRLCAMNEGMLYQDNDLQIGLKSEFTGTKGKMMLYFGNLSNGDLTNFQTSIVNTPNNLTVSAGPCPAQCAVKAQTQQPFMIDCKDSFDGWPKINVIFNLNGTQKRLLLDLPIVIAKFFAPRSSLNGPDFFNKWKTITNESAETFQSRTPIDVGFLTKLFSQGFKMSVLENVDPIKSNFILGANFVSEQNSEEIVLVRIESNIEHHMFRLTVRAQSQQTANFVKAFFVAQLGK